MQERWCKLVASDCGPKMHKLLQEIKRRNVFRVALVYIIAGWLTMQIVDVMFPALNLPEWMVSAVAALLLIGFPFALIFAWAFELTPEGIKREKDVDRSQSITAQTGRKLNQSALIILAIAVAFLLIDKFFLRQSAESEAVPQAAERVDAAPEISATDSAPSIAVLPFVNMSADMENEYFSDGLSEELLNVLARIPQLRVAGRTSSFAFKGKNDDLRTIGDALNVEHILEGSVRRSNTRLRITAQLIDTDNGFHLWSETYDRELDDVFAIQDEIANAVADSLKLTLLGTPELHGRGTDSLRAYELFLQAQYLFNQANQENLEKAIAALETALQIDSQFARGWALLARVYQLYVASYVPPDDNFGQGFTVVREYANRAVTLDGESADARIALGVALLMADWNLDAANQQFSHALGLEPGNVDAVYWLALLRHLRGDQDSAIRLIERALATDPLSIGSKRLLADIHASVGAYDRAKMTFEDILALSPDVARVHSRLARLHLIQGQYQEARAELQQEPVEGFREQIGILILARAGPAQQWRDAALSFAQRRGRLYAFQLAEIYAWGGDADEAFHWLGIGQDIRDPGVLWSRVSLHFDPIKDDPRWPEHLAAIGLAD